MGPLTSIISRFNCNVSFSKSHFFFGCYFQKQGQIHRKTVTDDLARAVMRKPLTNDRRLDRHGKMWSRVSETNKDTQAKTVRWRSS